MCICIYTVCSYAIEDATCPIRSADAKKNTWRLSAYTLEAGNLTPCCLNAGVSSPVCKKYKGAIKCHRSQSSLGEATIPISRHMTPHGLRSFI